MPNFLILNRFVKYVLAVLIAVSISPLVSANDHGGAGGPEPFTFTVNVGPSNYLQIGFVFETGSPEAAHELGVYRPKIQHEMIMLLSGAEEAKLRTLEGKHQLMDEIIEAVNHVIHDDTKTGVKDVLLTTFIIQ